MAVSSPNIQGIKAVVFDVFGTLARIREKRHPYRQLLEQLRTAGRQPHSDDAARIMSANVGLAGAALLLGIDLPASAIAPLEIDLCQELSTIELFPDVLSTVSSLRAAGFKLALCSNLAAPYAIPVRLLLPPFDAYIWSFATGAVKPEPAIYKVLCRQLDCAAHEMIMIGDSPEADCRAPRRLGIHGFHLARQGDSPVAESIRTLDDVLGLLGCDAFWGGRQAAGD